MLSIRPTVDIDPDSPMYAWLHIQFHPQDNTVTPHEAQNTWKDYIDSGEINNLAILLDDRFVALVRVDHSCEQGGTLMARHVRLLRKVVDISPGTSLPVASGTYSEYKWLMA